MALPDRLDGDRLVLCRWSEDHVDAVLDAIAASLDELRRWMPWAQEVPSREEELSVLRRGRQQFDAGTDISYFLFEKDTSQLVGAVGLHSRPPGRREIGYWVRTDRHGRGYATEATRVLTDAAFGHLPTVDMLEIRMDQANVASARVPAKAGFERTGDEHSRERLTLGHTGRGWIWTLDRATWAQRAR